MRNQCVRTLLVLAATAAFLPCACTGKKTRIASYEFTAVRRGTLERTVSSSGAINPVATVKVLPRMSGKVENIYVDYNDAVRKGDILAVLNTDVLRLKREQQYAAVSKARANYELQLINYRNQQALAEKGLISEYELKTSKTLLDGQAADLAVAEANLKEIETEINQYAYITSPIDGIVLDRNINIGDTVVDSSSGNSSSSIFVLAENLREMQIEAGVGELDITSINKGQAVRFTLESLPGRSFMGQVETMRMVPVVSNNVVSYTVIINVENRDGSLLPGMTCAVDFIVERGENVLTVPNAALRYQPTSLSTEQIADMVFNAGLAGMSDEQRQAALDARTQARAQTQTNQNQNQGGITNLIMGTPPPGGRQGGVMMGGRQGGPNMRQAGEPGQRRGAVIMRSLWYIADDGKLEVMRVQAGISNGSLTEIISTEELEGRQFILRERI
ncbi:MAG: efflux RND transporter periplasmic adaptor subunit [Treponema sp.]|nr:efflux RND transporter periplasmic adaptor subunit [Treponema sp.]